MAVISDDAAITRMIAAYSSFLQGKERARRERNIGAKGFQAGIFDPNLYRSLVQMSASKSAYLNDAGKFASPEQFNFFNKTISGAPIKDVNRMRQAAFKSITSNKIDKITEAQWFNSSTARLELFKLMENRFARDLLNLVMTTLTEQETRFIWILGSVLVLLFLTAIIVIVTVRSIVIPINDLTTVMKNLAEGDNSVEIKGTEKKKSKSPTCPEPFLSSRKMQYAMRNLN